jgi:hypothetical protein
LKHFTLDFPAWLPRQFSLLWNLSNFVKTGLAH